MAFNDAELSVKILSAHRDARMNDDDTGTGYDSVRRPRNGPSVSDGPNLNTRSPDNKRLASPSPTGAVQSLELLLYIWGIVLAQSSAILTFRGFQEHSRFVP